MLLKTGLSHILGIWLACNIASAQVSPQFSIPKIHEKACPTGFTQYYAPSPSLMRDLEAAEQILDLFQMEVTDSLLSPKTQRHRFPLSFTIEYLAGLYWENLTSRKEKFIGTCARDASVYDGMLREYDANYFPTPHLPAYIDKLLLAKGGMNVMGRGLEHAKIYQPPFECAEELKIGEKGYLSAECECTPRIDLRPQLDSLFYPALSGSKMKHHPNFMTPYMPMGFYGPLVLDCNHECHPEIHPYEWIWWMDMTSQQMTRVQKRTFFAGLFYDVSRRFRSWSHSPKIGRIKIPVAFPADAQTAQIQVEHLVIDEFHAGGLERFQPLPHSFSPTFTQTDFQIGKIPLSIRQNHILPTTGLRYALSEFHLDTRNAMYWGWLVMDISAKDIYTTKITVSYD